MDREINSNNAATSQNGRELEFVAGSASEPNLKDPRVVLSLLEADQVVAAKRLTHFGPRRFSFGLKVMLWSLRVYVVVMFVIVLVTVLQVLNPGH